jgi:egghead protein (zeste-white 4 protein)
MPDYQKYQAPAHRPQPPYPLPTPPAYQKGDLDGAVNTAEIVTVPLSSIQKSATSEAWGLEAAELELWDQPTWLLAPVVAPARLGAPETGRDLATLFNGSKTFTVLRPWLYRSWLLVATVILSLLLLRLQAILDTVPSQASIWQIGVQWAELTWLAPVPLAVILWLGWFIFAEAVQPGPAPIKVPFVSSGRGAFPLSRPVKLVFRFVTRGDNVDVLRNSVMAVHQAFTRYSHIPGPYQIEIISECSLSLRSAGAAIDDKTHIYVVPSDYVTKNRSLFKARALAYLQEQVCPGEEDWYVYLDEESLIDEIMLAGIYRFVLRSMQTKTANPQVKQVDKKHRPARLIGQGAILYQGGNRFFRGADALRTADDLGRFRLQYALGVPIFGVHGSFIVIRGEDDARLSFDVGPANSITEDTAWALYAWSKGFRFMWVDGYLHEQPPQRLMDFVKQRSRWLSGIRCVLCDTKMPLRYRICLGIFATLWQFAFLPFLVALAALFVHASPFVWMRLPADFAWATFVLAYFQGIDVQVRHSQRLLQGNEGNDKKRKALVTRIFSWSLVLCYIWYSLLEVAGVLYSLRPKQGFFVIRKPSLSPALDHKNAKGAQEAAGARVGNVAKVD